jgi:hypothetical protein
MAMLVLCAVVLISLTHTDDPYCQCRRPETKRSYAEHEQTISPRTSSRATLSSRSKSSRREAMSSGSTRCPSFSQRACVWYVRRPASCVQYSPLTISGLGDRTQSPRPRHRRDNLWSEPPHLFHLPGDGLPPAWTLGPFYAERREVFEAIARKHLDGLARWVSPVAGMFLWIDLSPAGITDTYELIRHEAYEKGVLAVPGYA